MLDTPLIITTADQLTAILPLTVPRAEIGNVMFPGLQEVLAALAAQGIAPAGPWFAHHLRMSADQFDFEICVPVSSPVTATGRVKPGRWPSMTVARTIYRGPYEELRSAWGEFNAWLQANGHLPAADLWERYLVGPESGPDPTTYRTELSRQVVGMSV